jgi:excisionase family DNA binding protein
MTAAYLAPSEVADLLGVSHDTVLRAVARGELPAIRLGARLVRIARTDVDAWLAARAVTPRKRRLRSTA